MTNEKGVELKPFDLRAALEGKPVVIYPDAYGRTTGEFSIASVNLRAGQNNDMVELTFAAISTSYRSIFGSDLNGKSTISDLQLWMSPEFAALPDVDMYIVRKLGYHGETIAAVKYVRAHSTLGLKESKDWIEGKCKDSARDF
jgi:hypothetical protein